MRSWKFVAWLLGGAALGVCGAACGASGEAEVDGGDAGAHPDTGGFVQYDSARGDAVAPLDPSRLVAGRVTYRDRLGVPVELDAWTDSVRSEVCAAYLHNDGVLRCMPLEGTVPWSHTVYEESGGRSRFADADCTVPAVVVDATWKVKPKYIRRAYDGPEVHYGLHAAVLSPARELFEGPVCDAPPDGGLRDALPPLDAACGTCQRVSLPAGAELYVPSAEVRGSELGELRRF